MLSIPSAVLATLAASGAGVVRAPAPLRTAPDTIYALAVDSAKYPRESFVYLLDDGVLRYEADGRGSSTYRQVVQVLKQSAVSRWAEFSYSYEPAHQRLTVNWAKVVTPTGAVISDQPGVTQDADVPAPMRDPAYVERKVRRLSLPNVRPGTLVDISWTIEELRPYRPGDFFSPWRVTIGVLTRRSRLVLDLPVSLKPRIVARNLGVPALTKEAAGRRITTWAAQEVPSIEPEPFAADSNGVIGTVTVSAPASWQDVGAWYAGLARERYAVTPAVEQKLTSLVVNAKTLEDTIKALHKYVTEDVRYVAISLGMGGYQPRAAADVVATGYGDCKDKATLFISFLSRVGIEANPVLLSAGGRVERQLPTIAQFNHAIAAVERPTGRVFVDLTAAGVPWGSLPAPDQGQFALVVHPDGRTEETTIPERDRSAPNNHLEVSAVLDTTGRATARVRMSFSGQLGESFARMMTGTASDSTARARMLRSLATGIYPEAEGDSLQLTDQTERGGSFTMSLVARNGRAARLAGPVMILSPGRIVGTPGDLSAVISELQTHQPRRFTIDASRVPPAGNGDARFRIELPEGWRAELPKNVALSGQFGEVTISYAQEGRVLTIASQMKAGKGVLGPERVGDLIAWLQRLSDETRDAGSIVLVRNPKS